jgi:hypothetical protein
MQQIYFGEDCSLLQIYFQILKETSVYCHFQLFEKYARILIFFCRFSGECAGAWREISYVKSGLNYSSLDFWPSLKNENYPKLILQQMYKIILCNPI